MRIINRKVLAREILYFFCCIVLGILTWLIMELKNVYVNSQIAKIETYHLEIVAKLDSLEIKNSEQMFTKLKSAAEKKLSDSELEKINLDYYSIKEHNYIDTIQARKVYNKVNEKYDIGSFNTFITKIGSPDRRLTLYNKVLYSQYPSLRNFNDFVWRIPFDSSYKTVWKIKNEISRKKKQVSNFNDKILTVKNVLLIAFLLVFVLRYSYYTVNWSIKTLKSQ